MAVTAYTTTAQLVTNVGARLYQLLEAVKDSDVSANTRLLAAIAQTCDEFDAFLRSRFNLTTIAASLPSSLKGYADDCVVYRLAKFRSILTDDDTVRYKDAMTFVKALAKGEVILTLPPDNQLQALTEARTKTLGEDIDDEDKVGILDQSWTENW